MKTLQRPAALLFLCAALSGCTTVGSGRAVAMDDATLQQTLKLHQSTKADAERLFGQATKVYRFASGHETWAYQKTTGIPRFFDYVPVVGVFTQHIHDRVTEVALLFDPQGILRNLDRRVIDPPQPAAVNDRPPG